MSLERQRIGDQAKYLSPDGQGGSGFSLSNRLDQARIEEKKLNWEGSFSDYFGLVLENPQIARLSHARIFNMIMSKGVETDEKKVKKYKFFTDEIYGLEKPIDQLVEYFNSAAQRLEVRKRILLLMGPVGGGKSTIVTLLKRGLEEHSRSDDGAAYGIKGCPMNEEPLHLIPDSLRPEIEKEYGIHIEGDLCPHCRFELVNTYNNRAEDVPVQRFTFSEKHRQGIGTFAPSDPKSQDISELVGGIDLSTIGEVGSESDPRAYRFDGELNIGNRGLVEFIEMLKTDERFLYTLLTLSQEQNIKTGRFSMIYADEVVVSHTNENEYSSFVGNKKSEALQDRIILVKVPYNLRVSDEVRIYKKLLSQSGAKQGKNSELGQVHIAPKTLEIAAKFAVLTRFVDDTEISKKVEKMRAYDGEQVDGYDATKLKLLQDAPGREGMDGISPRYVINRISSAMVRGDTGCVNPIDVMRSLRDGFEQHTSITKEDREKYLELLSIARQEYDATVKTEVQRAFVHAFSDAAKTLFDEYLYNI